MSHAAIPSREVILSTLEGFHEGSLIWPISELVRLGYPEAFVTPLAETYCDDPGDAQRMLRSASTGRRLEHTRGVHDLDLIYAIAEAVGASTDSPFLGRGSTARHVSEAIRNALSQGEQQEPAEPAAEQAGT